VSKNNLPYHYVEQTLILTTCTWQQQWERPVPCANHSTGQLTENYSNSQVGYRIKYLIYKHSTFFHHKLIPVLPNATVL